MANEQTLSSMPIPEQVFVAGKAVTLDLSQFFVSTPGQTLIYSIEHFPPGLTIAPTTGVVTGQAISVPFNTPFLVSVKATDPKTQESVTEYFPITIVIASEAGQEGLVTKVLRETGRLMEIPPAQLHLWLQLIIQEHYACVYIFNGAYPPVEFGGAVQIRTAKTGFMVYNFENYLIIGTGEMAFAESGNRGRMVKTLEEVYMVDLPAKNWPAIGIIGTDNVTVAKAWVVGKLMGLPVSETAPNDEAIFNYRNLARLRGLEVGPGLAPHPG